MQSACIKVSIYVCIRAQNQACIQMCIKALTYALKCVFKGEFKWSVD